jgi:hypothetical protein
MCSRSCDEKQRRERACSPPPSIWTAVACVATRPCDCLIGERLRTNGARKQSTNSSCETACHVCVCVNRRMCHLTSLSTQTQQVRAQVAALRRTAGLIVGGGGGGGGGGVDAGAGSVDGASLACRLRYLCTRSVLLAKKKGKAREGRPSPVYACVRESVRTPTLHEMDGRATRTVPGRRRARKILNCEYIYMCE